MNVLVTGTAGFIGFYLVQKLLNAGHTVYGIDSINHYYDVTLKHDRLHACGKTIPFPVKKSYLPGIRITRFASWTCVTPKPFIHYSTHMLSTAW